MRNTMTLIALEFATSMLGAMKPEYKKKIQKYLDYPTEKNWENIYSIIINGTGRPSTVWQAVIAVDPLFPSRTCMDGNLRTRWRTIPSVVTLKKAITLAVFKIGEN